jgi:hypothetical protein
MICLTELRRNNINISSYTEKKQRKGGDSRLGGRQGGRGGRHTLNSSDRQSQHIPLYILKINHLLRCRLAPSRRLHPRPDEGGRVLGRLEHGFGDDS